jgi:galactonate dehydratase
VGQPLGLQPLVENHDIDYVRATLPNVGGITEMMKVAAICETHFVGIVPHFTGPIATAALVNSSGYVFGSAADGIWLRRQDAAASAGVLDFKDGKLYPNDRPGLGVELDMKQADAAHGSYEIRYESGADLFRPDGSITNW